MIGLDTNVLARACLDDDPIQSDIAKKMISTLASQRGLFISSYALLELVWVLKVKGVTRHKISAALLTLLDSPGIEVAERMTVVKALRSYERGNADFGDYLILAEGERHHCRQLATFDRALLRENKHCRSPNEITGA